MSLSQEEQDDIRQDYSESLQELTFNSAPIIKNLTIIAQENIGAAQAISKAVEEHIFKCPPAYKLPALYLLDSLCKNIGTPYAVFFGLNIFKIFTDVYTSVSEPIRKKMFELFRTWKNNPNTNAPLFAAEPTRKIDDFLAKARLKQMELEQQQQRFPTAPSAPQGSGPVLTIGSLVHEVERLIDLTTQRKQLDPSDSDAQRQLNILNQLKMVIPTLSQKDLPTIQSQLVTFRQKEIEILNKKLASRPRNAPPDLSQLLPFAMPQQLPGMPPGMFNPLPIPSGPKSMMPVQQQQQQPAGNNGGAPLLSMSLINSLQSAGLLGKGLSATFEVELTSASLAKPRPELVDMLYKSMPNQCSTCGKRFKNDENGKNMRQAHLDWHFRVNKRLREDNRTQSRNWYLPLEDWVKFRDEDEILGWNRLNSSGGDKDTSSSAKKEGENAPLTKEALEALQKKYIAIPSDKKKSALPCPICREKFDSVWNDDAENWVWMNAVEEKGKIYHATCLAEMKRSNNNNNGNDSNKRAGSRQRTATPPVISKAAPGAKMSISDLLPPSMDLNAILLNSKRKLEESSEPPAKRERV